MAGMLAAGGRRALGKVDIASTAFFVCDVQDRFRNVIHEMGSVISTSSFMVSVATTLDIPVIATEQYPKALLHTCEEVGMASAVASSGGRSAVFEKTLFSMCTPEVKEHVAKLGVKAVAIVGLETHVCVQQTCLDLLEDGFDVHIVVDGVSSQRAVDRSVALDRMRAAGAHLTTAESIVFMLMKDSKAPNFRAVSSLVKSRGKDPGNLSAL